MDPAARHTGPTSRSHYAGQVTWAERLRPSVQTVADLMAEVLRQGYEGQIHDPAAEPVAWH